MSSVTRLHLLSHSMLNVSCQKQKRCSSLPADSLTESPMEFVGQPRPSGAYSLLGVPGLSTLDLDVDDDDGEVVIGIRPKSSPLPRRKSSISDEDSEPGPPPCGSRRVSFADAKGLSLVQVKEFATWDVPKLPGYESSDSEGIDAEEYFLSPLTFSLPLSTEELLIKVREQKVELETIELLPGTTILKGVIRVLNISFTKAVYVRTTLDSWSSHFDLLAEYIPGSTDSLMDRFSFKLTLVPPFGEQGVRVDFCLRYETPVGTFWANNNNRNYVLFCHQRMKETKEKQQKENANKKSCLKTVGQNFSTVENISAMEASSQENISTDVSKQGGKMNTEQISDGQSGTSEEDAQELLSENKRNCSRRNRRRAARMARVKDLFAQRGGGVSNTETDESRPEAKQAAQEETPEEKRSDVPSFSEGNNKSEGPPFVSESLEICSKGILDVLNDTSPAHDYIPNSQPEKPESISLADSATLTGGASATDIPDNPLNLNDDPAPAEHQNINKSVSKVEESSQKQGTSYECTINTAAEPVDSVISAVRSESLVSQTNSFTFGTVVAPLYHQVFGRVGSETQSLGPIQVALNVGDLTQSYPHTERRETSCSVPADARDNNDKVQGNMINTQESKQECLHVTLNSPPIEEEETSLSVTANDILDHAETLQDPVLHADQKCTITSEVPKTISGDTVAHPDTVDITNTVLSNPQMPTESLHMQGEVQEDNLIHDLQSQTTAETAQAQLPDHTCTHIKTNLDATRARSEMEEAMTCLEISIMSLDGCKSVNESNNDNDIGKTVSVSKTNGISEEAKHDLNLSHINNSAAKEAENSYVSGFEILKETDVTTPKTSLETHEKTNNVEDENKEMNNSHSDETKHSAELKIIGEVAESMPKAVMALYHIHGDMFVEDTLKDEEKIEHYEMEVAVSKQEDFCLADTTEAMNWEMMVEEEEKNILTDENESVAVSSKAEDVEAVDEDKGEQMEDETASGNRDTTEMEKEKPQDKMVGEIAAAREKENMGDDADDLEDEQRIKEEQIGAIVAGIDKEEVEKELENVQTTKMERTAGKEELAEESEEEKREEQEETELEKGKHFAEIQELTIEMMNVQEDEEIEEEEEIEVGLNDDDEAGLECENQVKPREENVEEENSDKKEEILMNETGESEIVDAESESESITIKNSENKESLEITQDKTEDGLSAPVNALQDERVNDGEKTGEGQNAHNPNEMHLYKEESFQIHVSVTFDPSKAARDDSESTAAEGGSNIFAEEPESDQLSHDSASAESDSDDEVELYMHCLRAVHTGAQTHKDRSKDAGYSAGRRPSVSKSKLLSTPMPSISESLDEEPNLSCLHEDLETADFQPTAAALSASNGKESINRNVSRWIEAFSCSNISKTLLCATLFVVFVVVAYHYDFLACFGLYLISVIWLCCQGERQPVKNNNKSS